MKWIDDNLLKELISLARDGRRLHISNACHEEFLKEDDEVIQKAQKLLTQSLSTETGQQGDEFEREVYDAMKIYIRNHPTADELFDLLHGKSSVPENFNTISTPSQPQEGQDELWDILNGYRDGSYSFEECKAKLKKLPQRVIEGL